MGVGSFIVTNAFLSHPPCALKGMRDTMAQRVMKSLRSVFPLVVLGLVRVAAVKGANYQVYFIVTMLLTRYSWYEFDCPLFSNISRNMQVSMGYIGISSLH